MTSPLIQEIHYSYKFLSVVLYIRKIFVILQYDSDILIGVYILVKAYIDACSFFSELRTLWRLTKDIAAIDATGMFIPLRVFLCLYGIERL